MSKLRGWADMHTCASLSVCLFDTTVQVFSPRTPDIISHYPRHSSNTAGAREHVCFTSAPSLSHLHLPIFCSFFIHFPHWTPWKVTPGTPGDAKLYILEGHADARSAGRWGSKFINAVMWKRKHSLFHFLVFIKTLWKSSGCLFIKL